VKKKYLVLHDYGTGGVWAYVLAESVDDVRRCLPEFEVLDRPPDWMTEEVRSRIERELTFDVDSPPPWLREARRTQAEFERQSGNQKKGG
jgi:hypothetical protein